jgi:hypothetical protein
MLGRVGITRCPKPVGNHVEDAHLVGKLLHALELCHRRTQRPDLEPLVGDEGKQYLASVEADRDRTAAEASRDVEQCLARTGIEPNQSRGTSGPSACNSNLASNAVSPVNVTGAASGSVTCMAGRPAVGGIERLVEWVCVTMVTSRSMFLAAA